MALSETEAFKRDCHARWLLNNKSRSHIKDWIEKQNKARPAFAEDMRERLNREKQKLKRGGRPVEHTQTKGKRYRAAGCSS